MTHHSILHGFLLDIISETSQTPIKTSKLWLCEEKSVVFSSISVVRLVKNMSVANAQYDWISKENQ